MRSSAWAALAGLVLAGGAVQAQPAGADTCAACHGPGGNSPTPAIPSIAGQPQVPRLAGQQEAYLAVTLKMYRDNPAPGRDTAMSAVLVGMGDTDLVNLAHCFAHAQP